jgi:hypothetical protein
MADILDLVLAASNAVTNTVASNEARNADGISQYKEIIVALIAVLGVAFGAVVPVLLQRNKELNLKLSDQKREAYTTFMRNFTEISAAVARGEEVDDEETILARMHARDQLLLYGSDDVIRAFHDWVEYDGKDMDHETTLVDKLLWAMRKDVLGKTKVAPADITNLNSFNRG